MNGSSLARLRSNSGGEIAAIHLFCNFLLLGCRILAKSVRVCLTVQIIINNSKMASASLTHCVITAPSEAIAATYNALCNDLKGKVSEFSLLDILVVADPAGCRIGSGGGTLNALLHFISIHGVEVLRRSKVAIIHSGGDSRRAPLHTICGKAWAGLNCFTGESAALGSPLAVLLHELSIFCANMQEGSLVIASSDVLLDICHVSVLVAFIQQNRYDSGNRAAQQSHFQTTQLLLSQCLKILKLQRIM